MTHRPLQGRFDERAMIDSLVNAVREGLSGTLVLAGDPGIGKTRLLEHAADAAGDLRIARVCGVEAEAQLAYAGLHGLLRPLVGSSEQLPAPQRTALDSAFGLVAGPPVDRFLVGLATLTVLANIASLQPLLCLVDDAHWIDQESLAVLAFVARRLHADGLGLLFSTRLDPPTLAALEGLPVRQLDGLVEDDARELIATTAVGRIDHRIADRLITETGGNPLALIELVDELTTEQLAGGSPLPRHLPVGRRLEAHFLRRVTAMPAETRSLLLLASAASPDESEVVWRAAVSLGLPPICLDAAVSDGLIVTEPNVAFRHPLIRTSIYMGAAAAERRDAHTTLARATDPHADPDRRAWHLAAAAIGPDEKVAADLHRSAERARGRGGYSAEAALLARAAELSPDRHDRMLRHVAAGAAYLRASDPGMAAAMLDRAQPAAGDRPVRVRIAALRAEVEVQSGRHARAPVILIAASDLVGSSDTRLARGLLSSALQSAIIAGEFTEGTTLEAVASAVRRAQPAAAVTIEDLLVDGFAARISGDYSQAVALLRRAVALLRTQPDIEPTLPIAFFGAVATEDQWDDESRRSLLERLDRLNRHHGVLNALLITVASLAMCDIWAGRFEDAEVQYSQSTDLFTAIGVPGAAVLHLTLRAWQGREAETRTTADLVINVWAGQTQLGSMNQLAYCALVVLELGLGNYGAALEAARLLYDDDAPGAGTTILPDLIEAGIRAGDRAIAERALARLSDRASISGTPWAMGVLARGRALLADDGVAEPLYRESLDRLSTTTVRTEVARAHLLYGEWLRRQRRRREAREQLQIAFALFDSMGARAFAERSRIELVATGATARSRSEPVANDLTPHEAHVAALAAHGATNTEIAAQLFISSSTVEYHLSKIFRKLDITSRRQLTRVLQDQPR